MRLSLVVLTSCFLFVASCSVNTLAQSLDDETNENDEAEFGGLEIKRKGILLEQGKNKVRAVEITVQNSTESEYEDSEDNSTAINQGDFSTGTPIVGSKVIITSQNLNKTCNELCQENKRNYVSLLSLWIAVAALGILLLAILMPMVIYLFITRKQFYLSDNNLDETNQQALIVRGKDTLDGLSKHPNTRPIPIPGSPSLGDGPRRQNLSPEGSPAAMSDAFGISMNSEASTAATPTDSTNNPNVFNSALPKLTYTSSNMPYKTTKKKSSASKK